MTPLEALEAELSGEYTTDRQASALVAIRALVESALALAEYDQYESGEMDSGYVLRRGAMWRAAAYYRDWRPRPKSSATP